MVQREMQPTAYEFEQLNRLLRFDEERSALGEFGAIRPLMSTEWNGQRVVVVGGHLLFGPWRLFTDFLATGMIGRVFGRNWMNSEARASFDQCHPVTRWFRNFSAETDVQEVAGNRERRACSAAVSIIRLGWDLYVLDNHGSLSSRLRRRLRIAAEFQGARYEAWVAATCVRAGCKIDPEDDTDGSRRHPEFIAIHEKTGQRVAVEAKSRRRPGTKGTADQAVERQPAALGLGRLFAAALQKEVAEPFVVFIDANLPGMQGVAARGLEIFSGLDAIGRTNEKWNLVVVTNHPEEYSARALDPGKPEVYALSAEKPSAEPQHPEILKALVYASSLRSVPIYWNTTW